MKADDKVTLEITGAELFAVVKYHTTCARRIPNAFGTAALKLQAKSLFPSGRAFKAMKEEADALLKFHSDRAKELLAHLK